MRDGLHLIGVQRYTDYFLSITKDSIVILTKKDPSGIVWLTILDLIYPWQTDGSFNKNGEESSSQSEYWE